jgi:hypothetical protein
MESISAPGGFLAEFVLTGILLPIVASFILDGLIHSIRGRGVRLLLIASLFTAVILALGYFAQLNGVANAQADANAVLIPDTMNGAIQLFLLFSVPAALLGFGVRMAVLFLNPVRKEQERLLIEARAARHEKRVAHALAHGRRRVSA